MKLNHNPPIHFPNSCHEVVNLPTIIYQWGIRILFSYLSYHRRQVKICFFVCDRPTQRLLIGIGIVFFFFAFHIFVVVERLQQRISTCKTINFFVFFLTCRLVEKRKEVMLFVTVLSFDLIFLFAQLILYDVECCRHLNNDATYIHSTPFSLSRSFTQLIIYMYSSATY